MRKDARFSQLRIAGYNWNDASNVKTTRRGQTPLACVEMGHVSCRPDLRRPARMATVDGVRSTCRADPLGLADAGRRDVAGRLAPFALVLAAIDDHPGRDRPLGTSRSRLLLRPSWKIRAGQGGAHCDPFGIPQKMRSAGDDLVAHRHDRSPHLHVGRLARGDRPLSLARAWLAR